MAGLYSRISPCRPSCAPGPQALVLALPLEGLARTYKASFNKATPEAVISALKAETGMEFVYQKALLKMAKGNITCNYSGLTLEQLLNRVINIQLRLG